MRGVSFGGNPTVLSSFGCDSGFAPGGNPFALRICATRSITCCSERLPGLLGGIVVMIRL